MQDKLQMLSGQLRSFAHLWREADGVANKLKLGAWLASAKMSPIVGRQKSGLDTVQIGFRHFKLEFKLSRGELTPYAQIQKDIAAGVIPLPTQQGSWTIMDCGANIGLFSLFLKDAGFVVAVEPLPECHERLARNFSLNSVRGKTVRKAVSSRPGVVRMKVDGLSVMSSVSDEGDCEVEATTIDQIARDQSIEQLDLLKLDLEGHELEALRGARGLLEGGLIRRIYVEYAYPAFLDELDATLEPFGFRRIVVSDFNALYLHANVPN